VITLVNSLGNSFFTKHSLQFILLRRIPLLPSFALKDKPAAEEETASLFGPSSTFESSNTAAYVLRLRLRYEFPYCLKRY